MRIVSLLLLHTESTEICQSGISRKMYKAADDHEKVLIDVKDVYSVDVLDQYGMRWQKL